jgi:hypothetical protein
VARNFVDSYLIQLASGANTFFDNKTKFNWTAWVKYHADNTSDLWPRIITKRDSGVGNVGKQFGVENASNSRALRFEVSCATTTMVALSNTVLTADQWTFVACGYDTADKIGHIYTAVPGANVAEVGSYVTHTTGVGSEGTIDAAGELLIGARNTGGTSGWNGDIADVRFYDGVNLTLSELNAVMYGFPVRYDALIGHWPLGWGSPEPDLSGNGNTGTVTSATVSDSPGVSLAWLNLPRAVLVKHAAAAATGVPNSLMMAGVGI